MVESLDSIISIKNLRMSYGNKNVLNGINLEIPRGQIIGYIGGLMVLAKVQL